MSWAAWAGGTWAEAADVLSGVVHGPTGVEITGTLQPTVTGGTGDVYNSVLAGVASTKAVTLICDQDVSAMTLTVVFEQRGSTTDVAVVQDNAITKSGNEITFALPVQTTANVWTLTMAARQAGSKQVVATGKLFVQREPLEG